MAHRNESKKSGGAGRFLKKLGIAFGTLMLVGFLSLLVFACIFAVYIHTDLSNQVDFSVKMPTMNQTSTILYQDKATGQWLELQKLYDSENRVWVEFEDIPRLQPEPDKAAWLF